MLHLLLDWEYPHWMMMAGAILVAAGFIGLHFIETGTLRPIRKNQGANGRSRMIRLNLRRTFRKMRNPRTCRFFCVQINIDPVPELTRGVGIKLNGRV